jgi:guanylate kinase
VTPGKLLIITAPSGAGKTTIVRHLLQQFPQLEFSVSATTRPKREYEEDGKDYFFLSEAAFREKVAAGDFAEWEEVYAGRMYGTLRSEMERIWDKGHCIVFDIDVLGAMNLQRQFPKTSMSLFIAPPSIEALRQRLEARGTETTASLETRLERAEMEMAQSGGFHHVLVNDQLEQACNTAGELVGKFLADEL